MKREHIPLADDMGINVAQHMEGPYQYSLRGRTWENRPDIRIFFWAQIGVLIWIVPLPQISDFLSGLWELASKGVPAQKSHTSI